MSEQIKIVVTEDSVIGPIGRREAVTAGQVLRARMFGDDSGRFIAYRKDGTIFGTGRVGYGFELVEENVVKDLAYFKKNAEEDYMRVPISVLRYIGELERAIEEQKQESYHSGIERDLGD